MTTKHTPGDKTTFKALPDGAKFVFTHERVYTSMAQGPWLKVSKRRYVHATAGHATPSTVHTVGTIKVGVTVVE